MRMIPSSELNILNSFSTPYPVATNCVNEQAREYFNALGDPVAEGISESDTKLVEAIVKYLNTNPSRGKL